MRVDNKADIRGGAATQGAATVRITDHLDADGDWWVDVDNAEAT